MVMTLYLYFRKGFIKKKKWEFPPPPKIGKKYLFLFDIYVGSKSVFMREKK